MLTGTYYFTNQLTFIKSLFLLPTEYSRKSYNHTDFNINSIFSRKENVSKFNIQDK